MAAGCGCGMGRVRVKRRTKSGTRLKRVLAECYAKGVRWKRFASVDAAQEWLGQTCSGDGAVLVNGAAVTTTKAKRKKGRG